MRSKRSCCRAELERLKEEVGRKYGVEHVIGKSKQIIDVFKAVSMVAAKKARC